MNMNEKQMIKQINDGQNLEVNFPQYAINLSTYYHQYSLVRLSLEYYTLYESLGEGEQNNYNTVKDTFENFQEIIYQIFFESPNGEKREALLYQIDNIRNDIIKKMKILTSYADQLQIYEYVLNRKEANFYESKEKINDLDFVRNVVQFIFGTKDNFIVNENIKSVIGQLPVRMTKAKYFELLKDSLSLYKSADQSSLDTYIYMLKTSAMLYWPEGMNEFFADIKTIADELKEADYKNLSKDTYDHLQNKLQEASNSIVERTDYYMAFQTIINNLYVLLLTKPYMNLDEGDSILYHDIVKGIYKQFEKGNQEPIQPEIYDKIVLTEGVQEDICTKYSELELVLSVIKNSYMTRIDATMLRPVFESLFLSEQLLSNSIFIEFEKESLTEIDKIVDEKYLQKVEKELLYDLNALFESSSQSVKRAIIGNTLNKMPVFFHSKEEVIEYINQSISGCHDEAEKQACMQLVNDIMKE